MINGSVKFQAIQLNVHCFEVDGVLIDSGSASLLESFKPFFEQLDMEQTVLTHYHEDHSGGVKFLQQSFQIPVFMNSLRIEECKKKASYIN